ncbi:MAG: hypothetical protein H0W28_08535 [Pyrinomonadaceae bacterium]|nr:hypothetical protein [Pyrinomonadaceae bacterium]
MKRIGIYPPQSLHALTHQNCRRAVNVGSLNPMLSEGVVIVDPLYRLRYHVIN